MKKFLFICLIFFSFCFCGCSMTTYEKTTDDYEKVVSMFVIVEESDWFAVVYHKETKVMYSVSKGGYGSFGCFTLLVDEYGSPLLWNEKN